MFNYIKNYNSMGIKYKQIEILGVYMFIMMLVATLSRVGIISHHHLVNYETALAGISLFLILVKLLSLKQNYKTIVLLCNVSFVFVCIGLYYATAVVGFIIVLAALYTIVRVLGVTYLEQMQKYSEQEEVTDHFVGDFFKNYHMKSSIDFRTKK